MPFCDQHGLEFENEDDFLQHVELDHPGESPDDPRFHWDCEPDPGESVTPVQEKP